MNPTGTIATLERSTSSFRITERQRLRPAARRNLRDSKRKPWRTGLSTPGSEFRRGSEPARGRGQFCVPGQPRSVVSTWCQQELAHAVGTTNALSPFCAARWTQRICRRLSRRSTGIDFQGVGFNAARVDVRRDRHRSEVDCDHTRILVQRSTESKSDDSFCCEERGLQEAVHWLGGASAIKEPDRRCSTSVHRGEPVSRRRRGSDGRSCRRVSRGPARCGSEMTRDESRGCCPRSVLLAIESLRRYPSTDGVPGAEPGLSLLPRPVNDCGTIPRSRSLRSVQWNLVCVGGSRWSREDHRDPGAGRAGRLRHKARVAGIAFSPMDRSGHRKRRP